MTKIYPLSEKIKNILINIYHVLGIDKIMAHFFIGNYANEVNKAFLIFLSEKEAQNETIRNVLKKDMIDCYKKYLISPAEYFLYGFRNNKNDNYRNSFLSDKYRIRVLLKVEGRKKFHELSNKYYFYNKTNKYFKRKCIIVNNKTNYINFEQFIESVDRIFIKPLSSSYGNGCYIYDTSDKNKSKEIFNEIIRKGDSIVEELIIQSKEMGVWNESSCNTVRLPCFLNEKGFHILQPFMRTGRQGDIVDNAGHGGMFALIDKKNGIIISDAIDKYGNKYKNHPDSGLIYNGWAIPRWDELIKTAEDLFRECLSEHKYIGFDFALTDNGWVLVEGNWGQFVGQYINGSAIKKEFMTHIKTNK